MITIRVFMVMCLMVKAMDPVKSIVMLGFSELNIEKPYTNRQDNTIIIISVLKVFRVS